MTAISPRAFVVQFSELLRWDVAFFRQVKWRWPDAMLRPLGEAVVRRRVEVNMNGDRTTLPIISKISFGGEVAVTSPEERKGYKGRLFWANAGDLVYSKIRVKQGSLCIVPGAIGKLAVSAEYPVYSIVSDVANADYLALVVRSVPFMRLLEGLSHGGSSKTRIPPEEFERQRIPLPPVPVQRRIVAAWEASRKAAAATAAKIAQLEADIESQFLADLGLKPPAQATLPKCFALWWSKIDRWGVGMAWREQQTTGTAKYPTATIGEVCESGSGGTPSRKRPGYFGGGIPWVKTTEVRGDIITATEETLSADGLANSSAKLYPAGSIVIAMYGQGATRGRSGKLGIEATTNQACLVLHRFDKRIDPDYVWYYLTAEYARLRELGSGNNQPNLSAELIRDYPIVIPPLPVQRQIVERVAKRRDEIAKLKADAKARADAAKADVEAMTLGTKEV